MKSLTILFLTFVTITKVYADALDTWTNVANSPYEDFNLIAFGNGTFMALSGDVTVGPSYYDGTASSTNALQWNNQVYDENTFKMTGIAFGNGTFVESLWNIDEDGDGGAIIYISGTNSGEYLGSPGVCGLNGLAFGNGVFVAVGYDYENAEGVAYVSTNGQTWSPEIDISANFYPVGIAFGEGAFIVVGGTYGSLSENYMFYSTSGSNWYDISPNINGTYSTISCVNGILYTSASGTNYASYNAFDTWTQVNPPIANIYVPASGTNSLYVSVGAAGAIYTSTNSVNWTLRTTGITNNLNCIAYGDNRFVAAGSAGGIFVSGSTVPLLVVRNQSPSGIQLGLSGGLGPTYHIQASTNLSTWTNLAAFTNIGTGVTYLDTTYSNYPQRYYRAVSP